MYQYFNGILTQLTPDSAVVECAGVGYLLTVSEKTHAKLASLGGPAPSGVPVKLFAYYYVREELAELYGFFEEEECALFKLLITVSGIGPKAAVSILSALTVKELVLAVANEDAKSISRAQGVGLKTAQKLILELKDKLLKRFAPADSDDQDNTPPAASADVVSEAVSALQVLGYSRSEALTAAKKAKGDTVEELIRSALKQLMK